MAKSKSKIETTDEQLKALVDHWSEPEETEVGRTQLEGQYLNTFSYKSGVGIEPPRYYHRCYFTANGKWLVSVDHESNDAHDFIEYMGDYLSEMLLP